MTKKITPTQLRQKAQDLIRAGKMPTLQELLAAIAETRAKFLPKIEAERKKAAK